MRLCRGERRRFILFDEDMVVWPVPGGNPMPPPQLARDAPWLDVAHPFEIGLRPALRHEACAPVLDSGDRRLRQFGGVHIPLVHQPGLDDDARTVTVRDAVQHLLLALDQPFFGKVGKDLLARLVPVHALIFFRNFRNGFHLCLRRHQVDQRQIVAAADLKIVEVMRRGDLHRARPFFRIRIFVGDDRDRPVRQRQDAHTADHMPVALVVRMNGHGAVAKHGFGAGRRDGDIFVL